MARSQVGRRSEDQEKVSSVERLHRSVVVGLGLDVDLETVFDDVQQVPELVQLSLGNANRVLQKISAASNFSILEQLNAHGFL